MAGPQSLIWLILLLIVLAGVLLSVGVVVWAVQRRRRDRERVRGFEVQPVQDITSRG